MSTKKKITTAASGALAVAAVTGLFSGMAYASTPSVPGISSSVSHSAVALAGTAGGVMNHEAGKHDCKGHNECKGQGGCKTGDNGCKGKNSCKGHGGCKSEGHE